MLIYYNKLFPKKSSGIFKLLFAIILILETCYLYVIDEKSISSLLIIAIFMVLKTRFFISLNWLQAIHAGIMCILYICCMYSIIPILGLAVLKNGIIFNNNNILFITITTAIALFSILRRFFLNDAVQKRSLYNISFFIPIIFLDIIAFINIIVLNKYLLLEIWSVVIVFNVALFTMIVQAYIILYISKSNQLSEIQSNKKILKKQLEQQLSHYTTYKKNMDSFQTFTHDYNSLMVLLESLIRANELEYE